MTATALILAVALGSLVNGISAFVIPLYDAYGWQRGDVSAINFSGIIGMAFGGIFVGGRADRYGARPLVIFGSVVVGLCYLLASQITVLWQMYVVFFIAGFFGGGAINPPLLAVTSGWFRASGGLALGIVAAGQALGQGGVPFLSAIAISAYGTSGAFALTGIAMLATLLPLSLLIRQPPVAVVQASAGTPDFPSPDTRQLVTKMSAAILLCCTCMSVPLIHLVPLVQDICAAPLSEASSVGLTMLLVAIAGRLFFGRLADMIGAVRAYMTATAWMTLMVFGFLYLTDVRGFMIYAIIYGFGYGGVMTGVLTTMRELTPLEKRASAMGVVLMFGWFGHAIGGYQGGLLHDLTGNYTAAFAIAAVAGVLNLFIVSTLLPRRGQAAPAAG